MDAETTKIDVMLYQPNLPAAKLSFTEKLITLGRSSDCTLPIRDRFLSRKHAEIYFGNGEWRLRDCGSANGTFLNGTRVQGESPLKPGDRIVLGDSEVIFQAELPKKTDEISIGDTTQTSGISMPLASAVADDVITERSMERLQLLNGLAVELIEDRPLGELFDYILERVMKLMKPSRAALGLLNDDRTSFANVRVLRTEASDVTELRISKTLLKEVVEGRRVVSFLDVSENEKLGQALSIIGQSIRSALCAPLTVGESVVGVLYVDYIMSQSRLSEEDVRLMAQIARIAAIKLETTRLREEALAKQRMEEELRTAYVIQSRLLPSVPPEVAGYTFAGVNRPARTVSGDYFDYVYREDKVYFVIADVSGKGITAALVMASLETAFVIFTRDSPSPSELLDRLNKTLVQKLSPTKFVTLFAGILDPATGEIEYANAGHTPPVHVFNGGVEELKATDLVLGLFGHATYRNQKMKLAPGDVLIMFTDGIIEAENEQGEEFGSERVRNALAPIHHFTAADAIRHLEQHVMTFAGTVTPGDDVTIVCLNRNDA
jgi:phosphoserine phosphatase RsbU/P